MDAWANFLLSAAGVSAIVAVVRGVSELLASAHPRRRLRDIGEAVKVLELLDASSLAHVAVSGYMEKQVALLERSNSKYQAAPRLIPARWRAVLVVILSVLILGVLQLAVPGMREMTFVQQFVVGIVVAGIVTILVDGYHSLQLVRSGVPWRTPR